MNDPERLLRGDANGLPARLLRAGVSEKPKAKSLERTLAALGAASTTLGATSAAGALGAASGSGALGGAAVKTGVLTLVGLAKWAGVGLLGGAAVSLAAHVVVPAPAPLPPVVSVAVPETHATPATPVAPRERVEASTPPPLESAPGAEPSPPSIAAAPRAPAAPTSEPTPALAAEVAFVDRGRAAFQRGNSSAALEALSGYERTFPERRLLPEVLYLRMEANAALGDTARATELGRLILRDFAKSPHAVRARTLLGAP